MHDCSRTGVIIPQAEGALAGDQPDVLDGPFLQRVKGGDFHAIRGAQEKYLRRHAHHGTHPYGPLCQLFDREGILHPFRLLLQVDEEFPGLFPIGGNRDLRVDFDSVADAGCFG